MRAVKKCCLLYLVFPRPRLRSISGGFVQNFCILRWVLLSLLVAFIGRKSRIKEIRIQSAVQKQLNVLE